jgi:hypothetical protein
VPDSPVRGAVRRESASLRLAGRHRFFAPALSFWADHWILTFCAAFTWVPIVLKKSFWVTNEILETAEAFRARRREGPHHLIQKRPPVFVSAVEGFAAVAASKNRLSRDFRGRSIFDFCNSICQRRPHLGRPVRLFAIRKPGLFDSQRNDVGQFCAFAHLA